ncbi:flagellar motor protein MotB [Cryobacterium sp. SO2]|uniref:OmpA/MotB family protein n=1 Tax=Cryobacterium sp. SO2 TaxID=1897060 RepID=UPI00223D060A|nr:flagellar motor protein MotB [Cryobacterium sp. SO2]WEO78987.1 flagellar motor protein MotB [Cryobacterium sp. SO2]
MSARGRSRRRGLDEEHEEHVDERWMASYMDMVTVLMCMFIVLFAMSTVDEAKFVQLKNSLATGFGAVDVGMVDTAEGIVVPPDLVDTPAAEDVGLSDLDLALAEVDSLTAVQAAMEAALAAAGLADLVDFTIDERGLSVGLVGSETFFEPNVATLSTQAVSVLDTIGPILAGTGREVSVEGHADRHGVTINYPTDWELSSARATQVLRHLVERTGVAQERIGAIGYGSARPVDQGDDLAAMARNRRVDVVLLSNQPDSVRALIPSVLDGTAVQETPAPVQTDPGETTPAETTPADTTPADTTPAGTVSTGH